MIDYQQKKNKTDKVIDFSIITLFILYIAGAAKFLNKAFLIISCLYVLAIFLLRRKKPDMFIWVLSSLWVIINIISTIINRPDVFPMKHFIAETMRIFIPYLMIKCIGPSFFNKFFRYAYVLVLISFLFYFIEFLNPTFISSITPYLNFMTQREQLVNGGFYIFVYMHSGWAGYVGAFLRNCGFMWEPGAYSCVLVFMLVYYLQLTEYKIDKKVLILVVAILSTFSTSGYLALFVISLFFILKNRTLKRKYALFIVPIVILFLWGGLSFYRSNDFMKGKVDDYIERGVESSEWEFEDQHRIRITRLGMMLISLENAVHKPWGEGVVKSNYILDKYGDVDGSSSLAYLLLFWGWIGPIFLFYSLYKFNVNGKPAKLEMLLPLSLVFFSNPTIINPLIYNIINYYFLYGKRNKFFVKEQLLESRY